MTNRWAPGKLAASLALLFVIAFACRRTAQPMTTTNSSPAQPAQTTRITPPHRDSIHVVTLGDSLAYGAGDESGQGLAGRLKSELRLRGISNVTAVNLGVSRAQTSDLLARLKSERVRSVVASADAIVLSVGANDLFRTPAAREQTLQNPLAVADQILARLETIVREIRRINPNARILILGGYNPVPRHPLAPLISQYLGLWDATLADRFAHDRGVAVVKMADIVVPAKLSRLDSFHPGGEAYEEAAKRIAAMLVTA